MNGFCQRLCAVAGLLLSGFAHAAPVGAGNGDSEALVLAAARCTVVNCPFRRRPDCRGWPCQQPIAASATVHAEVPARKPACACPPSNGSP